MKYKTKPCEINAMEWTGDNMQEIIQFANTPEKTNIYIVEGVPVIRTLEGDMRANVGDYIIRGGDCVANTTLVSQTCFIRNMNCLKQK